jgi:hypothetical protein
MEGLLFLYNYIYMALQQLKEKLDFSFTMKDFEIMTKLLDEYIQERQYAYQELFCKEGDLDEDSYKEYIHYFITALFTDEDKKQHPFLERVNHFLSRNYECFSLPGVPEITSQLAYCFSLTKEEIYETPYFDEYDYEMMDTIIDLWNELYDKIMEYPFLNIREYEHEITNGISLYYKNESIDLELLGIYKQFITDMNNVFPKSLKRIDSILFVPQEYIDMSAGEGTTAYFMEDEIFMPEKIKDEDKKFFVETIYHEFGHFIFALLSESSQILWYDYYSTWLTQNIKMTRDEGKNEVEELFADGFSRIYSPLHDFIQEPSIVIIDTVKNILEEEF